MKTTHEVTIVKTRVLCDICEKNAHGTCKACGRDICQKHSVFPEFDPWSGFYFGDYPDQYCADCIGAVPSLAKELREQISAIESVLSDAENKWASERKLWGKLQASGN